MIERQASADRINEIINHPSIYPWVRGPVEGPLDFTTAFETKSLVVLLGDYGGFIFHRIAPDIYDAHSAILPEGRGKWAVHTAREALAWMFEREGAQEITMAVPRGNIAVGALVRILGAKYRGKIESGWWQDGHPVDSEIYSMTKMDWEQCRQH